MPPGWRCNWRCRWFGRPALAVVEMPAAHRAVMALPAAMRTDDIAGEGAKLLAGQPLEKADAGPSGGKAAERAAQKVLLSTARALPTSAPP